MATAQPQINVIKPSDESKVITAPPPRSPTSYALRLPCKGWRGIGSRGGYKSPRYRHANYIHIMRQQHKSSRAPSMKKGFPPCKYHSKISQAQLTLYEGYEKSVLGDCVRLSCVLNRVNLKEVYLRKGEASFLMYRGNQYSDLRSAYMLLTQLGLPQARLTGTREIKGWLYIGLLHDFALQLSDASLSQVVDRTLVPLDKLIGVTQSTEGYIFGKGALSVVEAFIAGVVQHCESDQAEWKTISGRIPALRKLKNLVFCHTSVHKWLQQKRKATLTRLADSFESEVVSRWLHLAEIPYDDCVVTASEEHLTLPTLSLPGGMSTSICGIEAIAVWLTVRQSSSTLLECTLSEEILYEGLGTLKDIYCALKDGGEASDSSQVHLIRITSNLTTTNAWLLDVACVVVFQEAQKRCVNIENPLLRSLKIARDRSLNVTRYLDVRSMQRQKLEIQISETAKELGLGKSLESMCQTAGISYHLASLSNESASKFKSPLVVNMSSKQMYGVSTVILLVAEICELISFCEEDRRNADSILSFFEEVVWAANLSVDSITQFEKFLTHFKRDGKYIFGNTPTYIDFICANIFKYGFCGDATSLPILKSLADIPILIE